jgi:hypothetical protein
VRRAVGGWTERNLRLGRVDLGFLDGWLHCAIAQVLETEGTEEPRLFGFYADRVRCRIGGLKEYEEDLARYVIAHCRGRRVVEIGAGLGELPIVLALNGLTSAGIEDYRWRTANRIRDSLVTAFSELQERYTLIKGMFPEALDGEALTGQDVTLLFTNVANDWTDITVSRAIAFFEEVGEVILAPSLFGAIRDEADQEALFARIAAGARSAERNPAISQDMEFVRFTFASPPPGTSAESASPL